MRIFLISSIYPSIYESRGTTPVVHYFAKEWVHEGHSVKVFHIKKQYPALYYIIGKLFGKKLYSQLGYAIPEQKPKEYNEVVEGVDVSHIVIKKIIPHARFKKTQLEHALRVIELSIEKDGLPDCFVGHWDNPQLELLNSLKKKFHRPTCLVFHDNEFEGIKNRYGEQAEKLINQIDLLGFRSRAAEVNYLKVFSNHPNTFQASSGISQVFLDTGKECNKQFSFISSFVFVGALIARKYPLTVLNAVQASYKDAPYQITYIGEGDERRAIEGTFEQMKSNGSLIMTGRIPRDEIISHLRSSDVFVMISKGEVFGLVYLEAMALGCITIASKNEGMEGIIKDGVNGFLCPAGNEAELVKLINRIRTMESKQLKLISINAQRTALGYSDTEAASAYARQLEKMIEKYSHISKEIIEY